MKVVNEDSKALFWSRVDKSGDCWIWTGPKSKQGYGVFNFTLREGVQVTMLAHRFSWEAQVGRIPKGRHIDHCCHNKDETCFGGRACLHRLCVRPHHCEPVTRSENSCRGRSAHANKTHCPKGHEYSDDNVYVETYTRNGNVRKRRHCKRCLNKRGDN